MDPNEPASLSATVGQQPTFDYALQNPIHVISFHLVLAGEQPHVKDHCCSDMSEQANLGLADIERPLQGATDKRIYWSPVFDEYGLVCQPSAEVLAIQHCPFCGIRLPKSRRDAWFDSLEKTGWKTWGDPVPREFLTHSWARGETHE